MFDGVGDEDRNQDTNEDMNETLVQEASEYVDFTSSVSNVRSLRPVSSDEARDIGSGGSADSLGLVNVDPKRNPLHPDYNPADAELLEGERLAIGENERDFAHRVFTRNLLPAAHSIVHLAKHASNERIRFTAAQYVTDRVMGRVQDNPPAPPQDPFAKFLSKITGVVDTGAEVRETVSQGEGSNRVSDVSSTEIKGDNTDA